MEKLLLLIVLLKLFSLEVLADAQLQNCAKSNVSTSNSRVFNGNITGLGEYPWLGHLSSNFSNPDKIPYNCTSSLITSNWVLTAAHCVFDVPTESLALSSVVTLGEWNTATNPDCVEENICAPKSIAIKVKETFPHRKYYNTTTKRKYINYDIALLRLERDVVFSPYIQPICLPLGSSEQALSNYEGREVIITGWGFYDNTTFSTALKRKTTVTVKPIDSALCRIWYEKHPPFSQQYQLCAGGIDGGVCPGDSGGPLLLKPDEGNIYYQIGVSSQGRQTCLNYSTASIYVRVDAFLDWIGETIEENDRI